MYVEKFAVWSDDGPYFGARFDDIEDAHAFIASNGPWILPNKYYVMMERWYEETP